jgi:hypothetical protein
MSSTTTLPAPSEDGAPPAKRACAEPTKPISVKEALVQFRQGEWDGTTVDGREWVVACIMSSDGGDPIIYAFPKAFFKHGCGDSSVRYSCGYREELAEKTCEELVAQIFLEGSEYELRSNGSSGEGLGVNDFVARNPWHSLVFMDDGV